jgi:MFS family permease
MLTAGGDDIAAQNRLDRPAPGARSALALLLCINLFNYVDRQVLSAVEPQIEQTFHRSEAAMGSLATVFLISYMLISPLFGRLADRTSRWLLVAVGVILWSLASGASGLAATFGALLLTRCFVGVGEAAYGPVAPTILSDFYPVAIRGRILAWFYLAIPVGSALGYALGGQIGGRFGWRAAFYAVVIPGIALGIWSLFMKDPQAKRTKWGGAITPRKPVEPRTERTRGASGKRSLSRTPLTARVRSVRGSFIAMVRHCATPLRSAPPHGPAIPPAGPTIELEYSAPKRRNLWQDYRAILATRSYLFDTIGMTAMTFAIGGIGFWMPKYIAVYRGYSKLGSVNTIFGIITVVAGLLATLLGGMAGDALRPKFPGSYFLVSAAGLLCGFPMFVLVLYTPFPLAWLFIFLAVFCLFFNTGPSNTILANVTHPSIRATAFALNIFIIHALGDAISPWVIGEFSDHYSMNTAFLFVSLMMVVGGLFWLYGARYLEQDTADASGGS